MRTDEYDDRQFVAIPPGQSGSGLLHPSTLILLIADAVPIVGVVYWGWDAFVLLALYWLETAIISFWMVARITAIEVNSVGEIDATGPTTWSTAIGIIGFFALFAGLYSVAYFHFLWQLFADKWWLQIHGASDFIEKLVIGTGMWIPLLLLFLARGCGFLCQLLAPEFLEKFERAFNIPVSARLNSLRSGQAVVMEFIGRIIIVTLTIYLTFFLGVFFWIGTDTYAPQIMLIVCKTIADIVVHVNLEFGSATNASGTADAIRVR